MLTQVVTYSLRRANDLGIRLEHPDLYHQKLMLRTGSYTKASVLMWQRYRISFNIEIRQVQ